MNKTPAIEDLPLLRLPAKSNKGNYDKHRVYRGKGRLVVVSSGRRSGSSLCSTCVEWRKGLEGGSKYQEGERINRRRGGHSKTGGCTG